MHEMERVILMQIAPENKRLSLRASEKLLEAGARFAANFLVAAMLWFPAAYATGRTRILTLALGAIARHCAAALLATVRPIEGDFQSISHLRDKKYSLWAHLEPLDGWMAARGESAAAQQPASAPLPNSLSLSAVAKAARLQSI